MGGLGTLPVELLGLITKYLCADAVAAAAAKAAVDVHRRQFFSILGFDSDSDSHDDVTDDESEDEAGNAMGNEAAGGADEASDPGAETADETDTASEEGSNDPDYESTTTRCVRQAVHDLAALASKNRYLHQVFDPVLYQWDHDHTSSNGIALAIAQNSLGTLAKALAMGLLDVNEQVSANISGGYGTYSLRPIEVALPVGLEASLRWLLEHGANPDVVEVKGNPCRVTVYSSPLNQAQVEYNNKDASLLLLDHGAIIHFAEGEDWSLGDRRSPPDERNYWATTALHNAATAGHVRVVERLLFEGAIKVDLQNKLGGTPLAGVGARGVDNTAMMELLLQHGADRADPKALVATLESGYVEHAMLLLCAHKDFSILFCTTVWKR